MQTFSGTQYTGVGVSPGRIIGPVRQMPHPVSEPPMGERLAADTTPEDASAALRTAAKAVQASLTERSAGAPGAG